LLLQADPTPRGLVLDRPEVIPRAAQEAARNGLDQRLDTLAGDFFEGVPEADLYLLKFILHDWDDESCVKILRNCRSAMRPRARVAVVEMVIDAAGEPGLAELQDLNMLVATAGRERSLDEYDA
jgi:O-methyltransferase domain